MLSIFLNDPSPSTIHTLSLHDALPICLKPSTSSRSQGAIRAIRASSVASGSPRSSCMSAQRRDELTSTSCAPARSEEHTSELQSRPHLVCRLLLEKKKQSISPS